VFTCLVNARWRYPERQRRLPARLLSAAAWCLAGLVLAHGVVLADESDAREAGGGRIDVWPLFLYGRDPVTGANEFEMLWRLVERRETAGHTDLYLRPVYNTHLEKARDWRESQFLYPLGCARKRPGVRSRSFFPLLLAETRDTSRAGCTTG